MRHRNLDPQQLEFWQFSFHEIGLFDLPAMINYILSFTQKPSLFYVGHNQGATALFVLLSTKTEFNAKILNAQLFAPIAFMDYPHPLISVNLADNVRRSVLYSNFNFFSMITKANLLLNTYCPDKNPILAMNCANLWFMLFGKNSAAIEMDPKIIFEVPNHISPTASRKQWNHFLQLAVSGKFRQYDNNGYSNPTEYNLLNVKAPMYFYQAAEDLVVSRLVGFRMSLIICRNLLFFF